MSVDAPAAVGFAGQPVAFTETVGNNEAQARPLAIDFIATTATGTPSNALVIQYRAPGGAWSDVPLSFNQVSQGRCSRG
ncbi:hypothetical protein GXW82_14210 [Streptacidiphilus sp. 4-A2]|nr:hypothetical protein [Streptacidiphilus sp. 4-A2]